jgi:CheY-like chemotaxis protein
MPESIHVPALTVLVVEDEYLIREGIVSYLEEAGCVVIEAETGERAIEICKSNVPVDVLFTDIQLPGAASGFDVAETFRASHSDMPVMYVSGYVGGRERCVPDSLFFQKPYQATAILKACREFGTLRRQQSTSSALAAC